MIAMAREQVMDLLPYEAGEPRKFPETLDALGQLKTFSLCQQVGSTMFAEINGIIGFVKSLQKNEGVTRQEFETVSPFCKSALRKMVNFYCIEDVKKQRKSCFAEFRLWR